MKQTPDQLLLKKWQRRLGLEGTTIYLKPIPKEAVVYDPELPEEDKYFIGIAKDNGCYTLYYDRPLTDEDVCHELLHAKFPNDTEEFIVEMTSVVMSVFTYGELVDRIFEYKKKY